MKSKHAIHRRALILLVACSLLLSMPIPSIGGTMSPELSPQDGVANGTAPIKIYGSAELATAATTYGWSGNGSVSDPYIIEGMTINGSGSSYCLLIESVSTSNIVIQNNTFFGTTVWSGNSFINAALAVDDCGNLTIRNNTVYDCRLYGIGTSAIGRIVDNVIRDCSYGIFADGGRLTIRNNTLENGGMVIGGPHTVEENLVNGTSGNLGYSISSLSPVSFANNTALNVSIGLYISSGNATDYRDNTFRNCTDAAIQIEVESVTVTNNTIVDCPGGIKLRDKYATLKDNKMTRAGITLFRLWVTEDWYRSHTIASSNKVGGRSVLHKMDASDVVINPATYGQVILVNCTNVTMTDQKIGSEFWLSIVYSDTVNILDNNFSNGTSAKWLVQYTENVKVSNNTINGSELEFYFTDGAELSENTLIGGLIYFGSGEDILIHNNSLVSYGVDALTVIGAINPEIIDNSITVVDPGFDVYSLWILTTKGTYTIRNNTLSGAGISSPWMTMEKLRGDFDIDTTNTLNGRPVLYLNNVTNKTVTGDYGQVLIANSSKIIVEGLYMGKGDGGISMHQTNDLTIDDCTFKGLMAGAVNLNYCSDTTVTDSLFDGGYSRLYLHECSKSASRPYGDVTGNYFLNLTLEDYWDGALQVDTSSLDSIVGNYIHDIKGLGIQAWAGEIYKISGNEISNCTNYAYAGSATKVRAHDNSFLYNQIGSTGSQLYSVNTDNRWDNGAAGNYWSNYKTRYPNATNDGTVWDTAYALRTTVVKDRYPLVNYTDRIAPLVRFDLNDTTYPDISNAFEAWAVDNRGIASYSWTFNGGKNWTNGTSAKVNHTYPEAGDYDILVRVWDKANNSAEASGRIRVLDNIAPVALAGDDITIEPDTNVTLNANLSTDNIGIVSFNWTFEYDGAPVNLSGMAVNFIFDMEGVFNITLTVSDLAGNTGSDIITVTVVDNEAPVAVIGQDQEVPERTILDLSGLNSIDNWRIETWNWTIRSPIGALTHYNTSELSHRFVEVGTHIVILRVTDPVGHWNETTINVTVLDITDPVALSGGDVVIDQNTTLHLDGTASNDNVAVVNWTWSIAGLGLDVILYGPQVDQVFPDPGVYAATLLVTDAAGNSAYDVFTITVRDITAPVAAAGSDVTVDDGGTVTFDAGGSIDNVGIVWYSWSFVYDGGLIELAGTDHIEAFVFDIPGVYTVTLIVEDTEGNEATDQMVVTVRDATSPIANAGDDIQIDQHETANFDGSGSSDNVAVVHLEWTFEYEGEVQTLDGTFAEFVFHEAGEYVVTLRVWDAHGKSALDTLTVTVRDITPPLADAGEDVDVDQNETVNFDGSGCSDNVGVVDLLWTFEHNGVTEELDGISPEFTFDYPGEYTLTLEVTDAAGNAATDIIIITVLDAIKPVSVAGGDVEVDQHTTVTFDGSGSSDNVGVVEHLWVFDYDGEQLEIYEVSPEFTFDIVGEYDVLLLVTDARGNWGEDYMRVIVRDTEPPVAEAGQDRVFMEGAIVHFEDKGSTDNVGVVSWTWTITGEGVEETLEGDYVTFHFEEPGEYIATLTVTDAAGMEGVDTKTITIEARMPDGDPPPGDEEEFPWALVGGIVVAITVGALVAVMLMRRRSGAD